MAANDVDKAMNVIQKVVSETVGIHLNDMTSDNIKVLCGITLRDLDKIDFEYKYFFTLKFESGSQIRALINQLHAKIPLIISNYDELNECSGIFLFVFFL